MISARMKFGEGDRESSSNGEREGCRLVLLALFLLFLLVDGLGDGGGVSEMAERFSSSSFSSSLAVTRAALRFEDLDLLIFAFETAGDFFVLGFFAAGSDVELSLDIGRGGLKDGRGRLAIAGMVMVSKESSDYEGRNRKVRWSGNCDAMLLECCFGCIVLKYWLYVFVCRRVNKLFVTSPREDVQIDPKTRDAFSAPDGLKSN